MQGYHRYPTISNNTVVFVSDDDLWSVPADGGTARRLTTGLGAASRPIFSPDGQSLAFAGSEEGPTEVYVMPSNGGPSQRLTFLGDTTSIVGWRPDGIYFTSPAVQCHRLNAMWRIDPAGGLPVEINLGPLNFIHYADNHSQKCVVQRLGYREYGYWKRYRGGMAGDLWIDAVGNGEFNKLISLKGDLARPLWIGDRIYFASDHEGIGNIYSCTPNGQDLIRHTHHEDFYVRNQQTDGKRIVYHAGGMIYVLNPGDKQSHQINIDFNSPRLHRNRKFIKAEKHLQSFALHPKGNYLSTVHRGKVFAYGNHEGPIIQLGTEGSHRYRLARWLHDGKRIIVISDLDGDERFEIYDAETSQQFSRSGHLDIGRVIDMKPSPVDDAVLIINHRSQLIHVDLTNWRMQVLDKSTYHQIDGFNWSPDGKWAVYGVDISSNKTALKLVNMATGIISDLTHPVLKDSQPVFDPEGKYIYFLSQREFIPTPDIMQFNYSFVSGMRPYLITLQNDLTSPFLPQPKACEEKSDDADQESTSKDDNDTKDKSVKDIRIDLDGIQDRILAFPIEPGVFSHLVAIKGKIAYISWPLVHAEMEDHDDDNYDDGTLEVFDFETQKTEHLKSGVNSLVLSNDGQMMALLSQKRIRVVKAGDKIEDCSDPKKSGWIDLNRIRAAVQPATEWAQMFREAWRLQRDQFWVADMSQVDWQIVYNRYAPLVDHVSTRRELSDLIWEMQGELGTSHAYAWGGDLPFPPYWTVGQLAIDYQLDDTAKAFKVNKIIKGDVGNTRASSPLYQPGINMKPGDLIWAVNGCPINPDQPLEALLVNQARQEIRLSVSDHQHEHQRTVVIKTLPSQCDVRYRDWVNHNRAYVHEKTQGQVGYIHIPDMSKNGFAEFHRGYLAECDRDGLIVDVRFNGGGNVSWLLLEKLARKRLGYDFSRWNNVQPYPADSPSGRMVGLTNEHAGSDGDLFTHVFKMLKLGPMIGKRTWGGVIGIWPRHSLVDGGMTSQPEFSFWFKDIGWAIENHGVDPDIEVEITPQDYARHHDPQLDRGIAEVLKILANNPIKPAIYQDRPNLSLPKGLLTQQS